MRIFAAAIVVALLVGTAAFLLRTIDTDVAVEPVEVNRHGEPDEVTAMSLDVLVSENIDFEAVYMLIETSQFDAATKDTLRAAVARAKDSPAKIEAVIDQLRCAMTH